MTNRIPALTIDSLATATIAYYITASNTDDLRAFLADTTDDDAASMTISELNENESIFDLFIDSSIPYDDNDIDALTDANLHHTDEFFDMIATAYADARRFIAHLDAIAIESI